VHWLKQCFWTYLDWTDIIQYLTMVMVMGVDYQVYVCVAALRHLRPLIVEHHQTQDLVVFLKVSAKAVIVMRLLIDFD
jgi:phosphate starvation-inducible membrane PsiE